MSLDILASGTDVELVETDPVPAPSIEEPSSTRRRPLSRLGSWLSHPGEVVAAIWLVVIAIAAFAPTLLTSVDPLATNTKNKLQSPSWTHYFGTDQLGRDLFSRTVHGTGLTLRTALLAVGIGLVVGALIGLIAGFVGGWLDDALMRVVDVLLAIPSLLLSLALITVLGFGAVNVGIAVGLANIAGCSRIMRAEVMRVRQSVYVEAAQTGGSSRGRVLFRHVLPNSAGPVIVLATLQFGVAILTVSSLSFLGYGTQPPTPEWGSLVASGRDFLRTAWWLTTMPGLVIAVTVLATNRVANGLERRAGS